MKTKKYLTVILTLLILLSLISVKAVEEIGEDTESLDDYFASILGESETEPEEPEETVYTPREAIRNAQKKDQTVSVENKKFRIVIDKTTGYLYLINLKNNKIWSSCPYDAINDEVASGITRTNLRSNIVVKYIFSDNLSVINSYAGSVLNETVDYSVKDDTISVAYSFPDEGFVVPLEFTVTKTGMDVSVIFEKIRDSVEKRVHSIEVLPYFGAAGKKESGYMVIPDGSGAIINYNNGKTEFSPYEKEFYGGNKSSLINLSTTEEEEIRLPFYAMCSDKDAFAATVTQGAEIASLYASVSGKSCDYNNICTKAVYRAFDTVDLKDSIGKELFAKYSAIDPVALKKYTVSYSVLSDEEADIVGIADAVRQKLFPEKSQKEDDGALKLYLDFFGAVQKEKASLGIRYKGVEPLTTYGQAQEIISAFQKSGIRELKVGYRYCSNLTYEGAISSKISPSSALGGKSGFRSLLDFASKNGVEIFPYANFVSFQKNGNDYAVSKDSIMGLQLSVVELYPFNINDGQRNKTEKPTYLVAASRYNKAQKKLLDSIKDYQTGLLLDESVSYIYSDYIRGGYQADRVQSAQVDVLKAIAQNNSGVMMSNPNYYAMAYADYLSDIPMQSSGYYIFDKEIPFVQLILKGCVSFSSPALNVKGIHDNTLLKLIETGSHLKFNLIYSKGSALIDTELNNVLYGAAYASAKESAIGIYKELEPVFKKISTARITEYLSDNGIVRISYDNGVRILLNYNSMPIQTDSVKVEANSYKVLEKGE